MSKYQIKLLFKALSWILDGQIKLMRHFGITNYSSEFGWDDSERNNVMEECNRIAYSEDYYEQTTTKETN